MRKIIVAALAAGLVAAPALTTPASAHPTGHHNPFCRSLGGPTPWVYVCDYSHPHLGS